MKFPAYEDDIMGDAAPDSGDGGGDAGLVDFMDPREEELYTPVPITSGVVTLSPENSKIVFAGKQASAEEPGVGGFERFAGTLEVDQAALVLKSVSLEIETGSLWTQLEQQAAELKSGDFLDVQEHPTATFKSTDIKPSQQGEHTITGALTVHGVSQEIRFDATVQFRESGVTLDAEFGIDRSDFGMNSRPDHIANEVSLTAIVGQKTESLVIQ